jgi:hypothetical protein
VNEDIGRQMQTSLRVFQHEREIFIGNCEEEPTLRFTLVQKRTPVVAVTSDQAAGCSRGAAVGKAAMRRDLSAAAVLLDENQTKPALKIIDLSAGIKAYDKKTECIYTRALHASDFDLPTWEDPTDRHFSILLITGWAMDSEPLRGYFARPTTGAKTTTTEVTTLVSRPEIRQCILPRNHFKHPSISLRFNSKVPEALQPILVQCVSQCRILLEKCQNFETLRSWIKFPVVEFPQWEDHFAITWGEQGEMAIYIHYVGDTPFSLGDCVAVLSMAENTQ